MNGITTLSGTAVWSRWTLAASLLLSAVAAADEVPRTVQFSDGFASSPIDGPSFSTDFVCPPNWLPSGPASDGLMPSPGMMPAPSQGGRPSPSQPPSQNQVPSQSPSRQSPSQSPSLPQADPRSPVQAPFTAGAQPSQPTQAGVQQASFNPGALGAATAPAPVAPNMIGDFFGAISSEPLILPGNIVNQAILIQPAGAGQLDYYRGVDPLGGSVFQTDQFIYVGTSNGQPASVMPTRVPSQLLQEFDDGGVFTGDPADLAGDPLNAIPGGFLNNAGPFIALDSGTVGDVDTLAPETPGTLLAEPLFNIHDALLVFVPTPGSGGGVGRQKIAENTSPIPRDRIFINQSTFTGVPLTGRGINVIRFSPGIEKAFFEQRFSIEVRFPFASTIDSDISAGGGTDVQSTQFGNIVTTIKALVRQTRNSSVAIGVSATAPTAKDLNVDVAGSPFLSIENESVHVLPFIGGTHNKGRLFSQWYLQGDFDTTGSPVAIRNVMTGLIEDAGTLNDAAMLYASVSAGYWIYQNGNRAVSFDSTPGRSIKRTVYTGGGGITGLAPRVEVHFNRSLDKSEVITSGPIQLRSASDFELTNLVVGGIMTFGTGASLTAAWGTPIIGQDDRQFDNEVRVIFEYEY